MFGWLRKRFVLAAYRRKLGNALVARYGREPYYTLGQVRTTLEVLGLSLDYVRHAYAGYCHAADFEGDAAERARLRKEMAPRMPYSDDPTSAREHEIDTTAAIGTQHRDV